MVRLSSENYEERRVPVTQKILYVEDEESLARSVKSYLEDFALAVDTVHSGTAALDALSRTSYALLILDWSLPDMTGLDILRAYVSGGGTAPVLFLTAQSTMNYKELGYDSGCDDFLTKPFELRELHLRVKALLKRGQQVSNRLKAGSLVLDQDNLRVYKNQQEILVTKTEYNVLLVLMRNPTKVISVDSIIENSWGQDNKPTKEALQMVINRLRKKIDDPGTDQKNSVIRSVHGRGYTIAGENES